MNHQFEEVDFDLFPTPHLFPDMYGSSNMESYPINGGNAQYNYARTNYANDFESGHMFGVQHSFKQSPNLQGLGSPEMHAPPSNLSTASGPSANSSIMGSPYSTNIIPPAMPEWAAHDLIHPGIVGEPFAQEYSFGSASMEPDFQAYSEIGKPNGFVDPAIFYGAQGGSPLPHALDVSTPSNQSTYSSPMHFKQGSQSPFANNYQYPYPPVRSRSIASGHSHDSQEDSFDGDESNQKGKCNECGKSFKDLKAHTLTHRLERPEKCPIQTCDYSTKGFARRYDKNRHTLTHYKGTMVCGFCPGSGTPAEKSFNRADVFKRHLTSVHAVEQTPPNSRKKTSSGLNSTKKLAAYATGKCSTCSSTFDNAQDFYEHLDDCVLRIVQQVDPIDGINRSRLAEVDNDPLVMETLRAHGLPLTTSNTLSMDQEDDDDELDDVDDEMNGNPRARQFNKNTRSGPSGGVRKTKGMTHSKGGVTLHTKGRKKRKDYPSSWGCQPDQMKLKKRVMVVFDGSRRLWKDDMMLSSEYEVRIPLADGKSYTTDLDIQTIKRANAFHDATAEEKGPDISDDLSGIDTAKFLTASES